MKSSARSHTSKPLIDLSGYTLAETVELFADPQRRKAALRKLMAAGRSGTAFLREGLHHSDAAVRSGCCEVLDHFMDEDAIPDLIANIDHSDPAVRSWALHALACERCKDGTCVPDAAAIVPLVVERLETDPHRGVRQQAAGLLAARAANDALARGALEKAFREDPAAQVRKLAGRSLMGGKRLKKSKRVRAARRT